MNRKTFGLDGRNDDVGEFETLTAECAQCQEPIMPGDFGIMAQNTPIHWWCWIKMHYDSGVQIDRYTYILGAVGEDKTAEVYLRNGWEFPPEVIKEKENAS